MAACISEVIPFIFKVEATTANSIGVHFKPDIAAGRLLLLGCSFVAAAIVDAASPLLSCIVLRK